jgi:hypothetical protein
MPAEPWIRMSSRLRAAEGEMRSSREPRWKAKSAGRMLAWVFGGLAGAGRAGCAGGIVQSQSLEEDGGEEAGCGAEWSECVGNSLQFQQLEAAGGEGAGCLRWGGMCKGGGGCVVRAGEAGGAPAEAAGRLWAGGMCIGGGE